MKAYVVVEFAVIEYEECTRVMGVFSSVDKAEAAIKEYEKETEDSRWNHEYAYEEFEVDNVWETFGWAEDREEEVEQWEQ